MSRRWWIAALCAAWTALGLYGALSYGHGYYKYRGFPPPSDPQGVTPGRLLTVHFHSPALRARRSYGIYLPPGYAAAARHGTRFPVLYLLHGSPGSADLFVDAADVGVALDKLVTAHSVRPFLIVMPHGGNGTFLSDTEWADTRHGRFESFVLDVVHDVDKRWPTLANRGDRALGGNSEGAYASVNIALRHLDTFSVAESWSGYFWERPTGPFKHASPATLAAYSPIVYVPAMRARLHRLPLHTYIYLGRRERSLRRTRTFVGELRSAGGHVTFATIKGGHDWRLWRQQTPRMLRYADRWFTRR